MVREQRRIISAATGLTGSGRVGGPGESAPSLALERMEFLGQHFVRVNAVPPNMEGRIVIAGGIERVSPVMGRDPVLWTAF